VGREAITVIIPAFNNEAVIESVLSNVKWADQILVVDSFSSDSTVEKCRSFGADIIQHEYINSAKQKNWAIPQARYDWIFLLDTDEFLPEALLTEIQEILETGIPDTVDAYKVARKNMFLGAWIKTMGMWPDYQTRLFRKSVGCYEDKEVHADVIVPSEVLTLKEALIHNATPSLSKQISYLDRYSKYQADELEKRGIPFRWRNLLLRPIAAFVLLFIIKSGFRDGFRGLFIAGHTSIFIFFTHAKLWEKKWNASKPH
jgi:glycosyltransferase involved in cell wall biosynthesis